MTLILAHNRFMACDSIQSADGMHIPPHRGFRKIVRLSDGSLFGSGGGRLNSDVLRDWARAGMDFDKPPKLLRTDGDTDGYHWMHMDREGRVFLGDYDLMRHQTGATDTLGEGNAATYARGALDALLCPYGEALHPRVLVHRVMHLVTDRCLFVRPPVYIFDLDHPELDP